MNTYSVEFPKTDFYKVYVEGPEGLTREEVLNLVTPNNLHDAQLSGWDGNKDAYNHTPLEDKVVFCETTEEEVQ